MKSILDFGALYGGEDETAILQAAIDQVHALGGGVVDIPTFGTNVLRIDGDIFLKDRVGLDIEDGVTIDCSRRAGSAASFSASGSLGAEVEIAVALGSGARSVQTKTAHGLAAGDWVYLKSQRACLHDDAGPGWRLGAATARTAQPFFAEPLQVLEIVSSTEFKIVAGLIFPNYRPDDTLETYEGARASATIQKINWAHGIRIKGGTFLKSASAGVVSLFGLTLCFEPSIAGVQCDLGYARGAAIIATSCLRGEFRASAARPFDWVLDVQEQARLNAYRDIGSWFCRWDVQDQYGCQGWDQSYVGGGHPGLFPRVRMRSYDSRKEGCTTHGGCYGAFIDAEVIRPAGAGVYNRARFSTIHCRVIGDGGATTAVGVSLNGWGALDVQLISPYIQGVSRGIEVSHAVGQETAPPETNLTITDAMVIGTSEYVLTIRSLNEPTDVDAKIRVSGLNARECGYGVSIGEFINGVVIDNVEITRLETSSTTRYGVRLRGAGHSIRNLRGHDLGENNCLLYVGGFPATEAGEALRVKYGVTANVDWASVRLYGAGRTAQIAGAMKNLAVSQYVLSRGDAGTAIAFRGDVAVTCTVPASNYGIDPVMPGFPAGYFDIPLGSEVNIVQQGAGKITFEGQAGVSILSVSGLTTTGPGATVRLQRSGLSSWLLSGDLA
ncbi:hypothetical protein ANDA3_3906 [plant metagenome]|uniref:Uncharacterized protein n=1 Tax=plant metagenome TaxID=1297885 RepID=A0A484T5K2_9ZZZZ